MSSKLIWLKKGFNGTVIWLGESDELYHPQQSIRTMSPIDTTKYYLKVPISITNTSTKRVLAPHTIENAAQITDWLKQIQQQDTYLKDELKTAFLGEVLGTVLFKYTTFAL